VSTERISPTAYYTGHVWARNGMSDPTLDTAEGVALFTALRPMMRVGRALTGGVALEEMLLQRHRLIDHLRAKAIADAGVRQVLEIAGGLSGRGIRFAGRYGDLGLIYVEGDLPAMAERKRERLAAAGLRRPGHHVVALDVLADSGPLSIVEATAGGLFDREQGIAIITEGLLPYFDDATAAQVWRRLAGFAAPFHSDVYLSDLYLRGPRAVAAVKAFERMLAIFARGRTHTHFAREQDVAPAMARMGFARTAVHHPKDFAKVLPLPGVGGMEVVQVLEASTRP
jgi:O-methyltransferase involved in polyketide biosynthesis